jgi:DNA-binding GntR family transcriptional regulator
MAVGPRRTARDIVADHVRREIIVGNLPPGRKLTVSELALALQVSQTPTREALQLLASEGLVQINAFRGAVVAALSADEYEEIFLMRINLEALAARLGAERITDEGLERLRSRFGALEDAARSGDVDTFIEADRRFHQEHYLASGRVQLCERILNLRSTAERYVRLGYSLPDVGLGDTVASHGRVLRAVERRRGDRAEAEITRDLKRTFKAVHTKLLRDEATRGVRESA